MSNISRGYTLWDTYVYYQIRKLNCTLVVIEKHKG